MRWPTLTWWTTKPDADAPDSRVTRRWRMGPAGPGVSGRAAAPTGAGSVTCARAVLACRVAHGTERAPQGVGPATRPGPFPCARGRRPPEAHDTGERASRAVSPTRAQHVPAACVTLRTCRRARASTRLGETAGAQARSAEHLR